MINAQQARQDTNTSLEVQYADKINSIDSLITSAAALGNNEIVFPTEWMRECLGLEQYIDSLGCMMDDQEDGTHLIW